MTSTAQAISWPTHRTKFHSTTSYISYDPPTEASSKYNWFPPTQHSSLEYQITSLLWIYFWISSSHHGDKLCVVYSSILYKIVI
jgi:hypothetical protein